VQTDSLPPKIIGVGFQKTGTSSLRDALTMLGYKVGDNNYKLLFPILHGNYKKVLKTIQRYDAVEDNPWPLIYKELDKLIPGCKFILTLRDEESWYESVKRHINDLRDPMHEWIYGRGKGLPKDDKANTLQVYRKHNEEVLNYFKNRPQDLLIMNITQGDGWEKLCPFLNKEIPSLPFPHQNKFGEGKPRKLFKLKIQKQKIKYWFQIQYLRALKLL